MCAILAIALQFWCGPILGERLPFVTFFPAVMFSSLMAGSGPGITTLVLCLVGWQLTYPQMVATKIEPLSSWVLGGIFILASIPLLLIGSHTRAERLRQAAFRNALAARSGELEAAFEMSNAGNAHLDPKTLNVIRANARFCGFAALAPDQITGFSVAQLFTPEERDEHTAIMRRIADGLEQQCFFRAAIAATSSSVSHAYVSVTPLAAEDGTVRLISLMIVDISERISFEERLRESEARFRGVAQAMPQLVWTCDVRGRATFVSDRWAAFTAQHAQESLGYAWLQAVHPDDRREVFRRWSEASESETQFCCPHRLRGEDGTYRRFLSRAVPLRGKGREPTHWIGTSTDIEDLKATEDAARRSESMFRGVAEANLIGVLIASPRGIDYVNDEMLRITGRSAQDADGTGSRWDEWIAPASRAALFNSASPRDGKHPSPVEFQFLRPDGTMCPVTGQAAPLYPGSDARILIAQDLSEQKKAQQTLRAREEVSRAIEESINYGVWTAGPDGGCTHASPSFLRLVGMSQEECAQLGWAQALHADDRDSTLSAWRACVESGSVWDHEHRFRGTDGNWHAILARGVPIRDENGTVTGWAGINLDISRLKAAEQHLQDSQSLLGRVLDGVFTFVGVLQPDGTMIEMNRAPLETAGITASDVLGRKLWETYWFSHSTKEQQRVKEKCELGAAGVASRYEFLARMGTDTLRLVDFMLTPLKDEGGRVTHLVGSSIDVTERRQAELDLRRANMIFSAVADATPDFIYRKDRDGRLIYANRPLADAIGLGEYGAIGRTDQEFLDGHPSSLEIMQTDQRIMATGQSEVVEEPIRLPDGDHVFLSTKVAERDSDGRIVGLIGISRDITERKQIQHRLEENERRYRGFAESVPAMLWAADPQGLIIDRNRRWEEYTGQPISEGLGNGWKVCVHPDDLQRVEHAWNAAVTSGVAYAIEYRIRRASDGMFRWHGVQAVASRNESGAVLGWFGTCADIQARKEAEQVLSRDRETLEALVKERTHQLEQTHQQLRFAERMAFIGTLSTGLGHDMGNLLLPMRVRLNAMSRRDMEPQMREDVDAIKASLEYFQRLANGLRLLAVDPEHASVDETTTIGGWTEDVLPLLKNVLPSGVRLVAEFPDPQCEVKISRASLTQIAFNLVQNAGDAMRSRGLGVVRLSGRIAQDSFEFKVADDGPGMTDEVKRRCMEPFFSTKARGVSTGLGLSLVFGHVKRVNGTLTLRSELGSGTEFVICLPVAGRTGRARRTAVVQVTDPRLRAFVQAELAALSYTVRPQAQGDESIDLYVCEHVPTDKSPKAAVVLIAEQNGMQDDTDIVVVGAQPSPRVLREALRRLAQESEKV